MEKNIMIKNAYRKLKSHAYFDKSQSFLRARIVELEAEEGGLYKVFSVVNDIIDNSKELDVESIKPQLFVKSTYSKKSDIISSNAPRSKDVEVEDYQAFFDAPIELHLIGMLWMMTIGEHLDKSFGNHLYGNRIKVNFREKQAAQGQSPYLLKPYFEQYESWRDEAIQEIESRTANNESVIVLNLDLKKYYYNVDIDDSIKEEINKENLSKISDHIFQDKKNSGTLSRLNKLVFEIIEKYSKKLKDIFEWSNKQNILPLGFMPSTILSNYYLLNFDEHILNTRPLYYGRYVDDIIIVYKCNPALKEALDKLDTVDKTKSNDSKIKREKYVKFLNSISFRVGSNPLTEIFWQDENDCLVWQKNEQSHGNHKRLHFNHEKSRFAYFDPNYSTKMISDLKQHIWENKSEFNLTPEHLFDIDYAKLRRGNDSTIKPEVIFTHEIDQFELSKFIGKHLSVIKEIDSPPDNRTLNELLKIMTEEFVITTPILWESFFTLLLMAERHKLLVQAIENVSNAIERIKSCEETRTSRYKTSMRAHLKNSLSRALSLVNKPYVEKHIKPSLYSAIIEDLDEDVASSFIDKVLCSLKKYRQSNLTNKQFMGTIPSILNEETIDEKPLKLFEFKTMLRYLDDFSLIKESEKEELKPSIEENKEYYLYPYNISLLDIQLLKLYRRIYTTDWNPDKEISTNQSNNSGFDVLKNLWLPINSYSNGDEKNQSYNYESDDVFKEKICLHHLNNGNQNGGPRKRIFDYNEDTTLKDPVIGIGNVRMNDPKRYFDRIRNNQSDKSLSRYESLQKALNTAIKYKSESGLKTNLFLLPEAFVPFEWIPLLVNTAKKNDMAIITGLEHLYIKDKHSKKHAYNFIISIFPVRMKNFIMVNVNFHLKVHYSPLELHEFNHHVKPGHLYEMHRWRGMNIAPYNCYELTNIEDRALFKSNNVNVIASVVFNRDVEYFSNIVESMSRDLNAFVIQANDASYGDSRIFQPASSHNKHVLRVMGGVNSTAILGKLNVKNYKEFLNRPIVKQKEDRFWKPGAPSNNT